jgi:hypothetical protein
MGHCLHVTLAGVRLPSHDELSQQMGALLDEAAGRVVWLTPPLCDSGFRAA